LSSRVGSVTNARDEEEGSEGDLDAVEDEDEDEDKMKMSVRWRREGDDG